MRKGILSLLGGKTRHRAPASQPEEKAAGKAAVITEENPGVESKAFVQTIKVPKAGTTPTAKKRKPGFGGTKTRSMPRTKK